MNDLRFYNLNQIISRLLIFCLGLCWVFSGPSASQCRKNYVFVYKEALWLNFYSFFTFLRKIIKVSWCIWCLWVGFIVTSLSSLKSVKIFISLAKS